MKNDEAEDQVEGKARRFRRLRAEVTAKGIAEGKLLPDGTPKPRGRRRGQEEEEAQAEEVKEEVKEEEEVRPKRARKPRRRQQAALLSLEDEIASCAEQADLEGLLEVYDTRAEEFTPATMASLIEQVRLTRDVVFRRKRMTKTFSGGITTPMEELLESTQTAESWEAERRARIKEFSNAALFAEDLVHDVRFKAFTAQLLEAVGSGSLSPPQLAEVAFSYGLLGIHSGDLFALLAKTASPQLKDYGPEDLTKLFSAFATAKLKSEKFAGMILRRASAVAKELTPQQHVTLVYTAALFDLTLPAPVLRDLVATVSASLPHLQAPELCRLIWALSLNRPPPSPDSGGSKAAENFDKLYTAAAVLVSRRNYYCASADLVMALRGLAKYSPASLPEGTYHPIVHRAVRLVPTFRVSDVADFLDSLTRLNLHLPTAFSAVKQGVSDRLHLFTGDELVTLIGAYTTVFGQHASFLRMLLLQLQTVLPTLSPASLFRLPRLLGEARLRHPLLSDVLKNLPASLKGLEELGDSRVGEGIADLLWGFARLGLRLDDPLIASCLSRLTPEVIEGLTAEDAVRLAWALAVFQVTNLEVVATLKALFEHINTHSGALGRPENTQRPTLRQQEVLSWLYQAHLYALLGFPLEHIRIPTHLQQRGGAAYRALVPRADPLVEDDARGSLALLGLIPDDLRKDFSADFVPLGLGFKREKTLLAMPLVAADRVYDTLTKEESCVGEEYLRRTLCRLLEWKVIAISSEEWGALKTREAKTAHLKSLLVPEQPKA